MNKPFGLKDEEYWSEPWKNLATVSWDRVDKNTTGILLDAPDQVPLDTNDSLPVLLYQSDTTLSLWQAPFQEHGIITALRLEDDAFFAAKALPPAGLVESKGPEPTPGFAGLEFNLDLRETLSLHWAPSTLWVTAFLRDGISNRVKVKMGPSASAYKDPAVEAFLEEENAKRPQRSLSFPRQVIVDAVTVPFQSKSEVNLGLTFSANRIVIAQPGTSGRLHVTWRLPVRPTDVSKDEPKVWVKGLPPVTAVACISLLLIGSEHGTPLSISLRLPAFETVVEEDGRPVATGSFSLDMLDFDLVKEEPQTWFIYGFSGDYLQGPTTVAVVSPESLPQVGR